MCSDKQCANKTSRLLIVCRCRGSNQRLHTIIIQCFENVNRCGVTFKSRFHGVCGAGGGSKNNNKHQEPAYDKDQLKVGRAINIFTRLGYLSISMRVIPRNDSDHSWLFREPTVDVFNNIDHLATHTRRNISKKPPLDGDFHMEFCDNARQLLQAYFRDFAVDRLEKPWRAFTGSWNQDMIARHMGINSSFVHGNHCYVLVRLSRFRESVKLEQLPKNVQLLDAVAREIANLQVGNVSSVLQFIKQFGSHYITSYVTGNSLYQVFVYERQVYRRIKDRLKSKGVAELSSTELQNFFSPWYAQHMGQIRVASGNRTVERWANANLRMTYYIFSYASLLKLHTDTGMLTYLNDLLRNEALLQISLRTLLPAFKDPKKRAWFHEVLDNYIKLWEVNM
ncbi:torso-like [Carabus blaptoides fortunei]